MLLIGAVGVGAILWQSSSIAEAAWYHSSWAHRLAITIDATQVGSDLTDFPVYVDLSDLPDEFHNNVKMDGSDIRVTTSDETTEVPREVVWYDAGTDTGELHFKAPSISSSSDTVFYIYYGNASASEPAADATNGSQNVWSDYGGVYHMQEASGDLIDSSPNGYDLVVQGAPVYQVSGKIGYGIDFDGDDDHFVSTTTMPFADYPYSMSIWGESDSASAYQVAIGAGENIFNFVEIGWAGNQAGDPLNGRIRTEELGFVNNLTTTGYSTDVYVYGATSYEASSRIAYINAGGVIESTDTADTIEQTDTTIGARAGENYNTQFDGALDEARFALFIMNADWVSAEYVNQNTPTTFYTVGEIENEALPEGPVAVKIPKGVIRGDSTIQIRNGVIRVTN